MCLLTMPLRRTEGLNDFLPVLFTVAVSRNQPLVRELAKEVQAAFPTASFSGSYGYEGDRMRITIMSGVDTIDLEALKSWLRIRKSEKKISANLYLIFPDDREERIGP